MTLISTTILIFLIPFITALCSVVIVKGNILRNYTNVIFSVINFMLSIYAIILIRGGENASINLISLNSVLYFGLANKKLPMIFAIMVNLLWVLSVIYSIGYLKSHKIQNQNRFFAFFSLAIGCTMGVAFSDNLLTTFLFYEFLTLSTIPLIAHKISKKELKNLSTYLFTLMGTSILLFLPAIILTLMYTGTLKYAVNGIFVSAPNEIDPMIVLIILLLFLFGISKTALMPFHKWLPAAMIAPTPVSALLHAVAVVKSGAFIIYQVVYAVLGVNYLKVVLDSINLTSFMVILPCITIISASIIALLQDNIKKRLAYSTISQLSYIILALMMLNQSGLISGISHIIAHAFGKITLFFAAGSIIVIAHKENVSELSGLGKKMPITMIAFTIGSLSMIGFPFTGGFISKFMLIQSFWENSQYIVIFVIIVSTVLNAIYLLQIVFKAFFEDYKETDSNHKIKTSISMNAAMVLSASLVLIAYVVLQQFNDILG